MIHEPKQLADAAVKPHYQHKDGVRRNQVSFRCNNAEYDAISARARAAGIKSHSEYIRHLVLIAPRFEDLERRIAALEEQAARNVIALEEQGGAA